jgi:hypothetical protein
VKKQLLHLLKRRWRKLFLTAAMGQHHGMAAPMLKLSPTMLKWLHRVIVAVWESGKAPVEWKRVPLVALYEGKGERKVTDSYRGISLLSIPGKV